MKGKERERMTTKEMIQWYSEYKGYTLSNGRKESVQRRIIANLCNDIGYGILSGNEIQRMKAKEALTEFCQLTGNPYPV